ncbi:MAG TPA: hypothetical protein ENI11_03435 [Actinobacteria bacterium]|nr:hypothetical protein [Actinomycetota bacterium]
MPFCPFCRKSVEPASIWCACGINLGKYEDLPVTIKNIKKWLVLNDPTILEPSIPTKDSLLGTAKAQLIRTQEEQVTNDTKSRVEISEAKKLIENFLLDCKKEGLGPAIDIGQLRRERWRQWKKIPTEYRQNAPEKDFRLTPGYLFETSVAKYKDEFCLSADGIIYKHQLNAPDPYPIDALLNVVSVSNLAEALTTTLVSLLKDRQKPAQGELPEENQTIAEPIESESQPKKGLRLRFGRKKSGATQPKDKATEDMKPTTAAEQVKTIDETTINEPEAIQKETRPDDVLPTNSDPQTQRPLEKTSS